MPFPCRSRAVPLPCRSAKGLDCVFSISFAQCGRVWFTHAMPFLGRYPAMPRICGSGRDLSRPRYRPGMGTAYYVQLASAVRRRHLGDLPAFGTLGEWQGRGRFVAELSQHRGRGTAWEWHGMCELAFSLSSRILVPQSFLSFLLCF
jgi:hypothetical protein